MIYEILELDNDNIISSSVDGVISIWNVFTGNRAHSWKVSTTPTKIALDSGTIASGTLDSQDAIKLWNKNSNIYTLTSKFLLCNF